jgi:plastin-1
MKKIESWYSVPGPSRGSGSGNNENDSGMILGGASGGGGGDIVKDGGVQQLLHHIDMPGVVGERGDGGVSGAGDGVTSGGGGGEHCFIDVEEKKALTRFLNSLFHDDISLARHFPLDVNSDDLFKKQSDGLILIKLLNHIKSGTVPSEYINSRADLSVFQKMENLNRVIEGAKSLGCILVNIGSRDIMDGR